MHIASFATALLACFTLTSAKHAAGLSNTVAKRQSGSQLQATFPSTGAVTGQITASQPPSVSGVVYAIQLQLPLVGGPFSYHVHVNPVNSTGSCASAGGHLDPANVTETPPCNPLAPQTCQAGDLSGKYGKLNGTSATLSITDPYTSLITGLGNSIVGRSIVVHASNGTRIACANLVLLGAGGGYTSGNGTNVSSPTGWMAWSPTATILPSIYTGGVGGVLENNPVKLIMPLVGLVFGGVML